MKLYQYKQRSENEQLDILRKRGVQIGQRDDAFYLIRLYQVDGFYVELYHHTHFNVTAHTHSFEDINLLEPYFDTVDAELVAH